MLFLLPKNTTPSLISVLVLVSPGILLSLAVSEYIPYFGLVRFDWCETKPSAFIMIFSPLISVAEL